jgi:dihydroxy-acid dehydratase
MTNKLHKKTPAALRSARWLAPDDLRAFGHRSRAMQMGYAPEEWKDRPVIAILNTWSDAQPCHPMAGGFPVELPAPASHLTAFPAGTTCATSSSPRPKS